MTDRRTLDLRLVALADQWDTIAEHPDLYPSRPDTTTATVARIINTMPTSGRVLDVGCGQGRLACPVADARPNLHVTALDLSPLMLAVAEPHPRVTYQRGDGKHAVGPVDGAWSVLVFQHLPWSVIVGYLFSLAYHLTAGAPLLAQFVAGDRDVELDHRYPPGAFANLAALAGFVDVTVDQAVADGWWWLTAYKPKAGT